MSSRRWLKLLCLAGIAVLFSDAAEAWAWGPATHVKLGCQVLGQLALLPATLAVLLRRHAVDFIYGNIAADYVFAKKLSRVKQFCHHWVTGFALLEDARTDGQRAFAHGYLAHLAADTVAHNKFLPRQLTLTRTTINVGHVYWEVRADCHIERPYRRHLRSILQHRFLEHEASLAANLTETFLPFAINRRLFRRMNLMTTNLAWHEAMRRWHLLSRWDLCPDLLGRYHDESVERILSLLAEGAASPLVHEDPNGNAALGFARHHRRQLRQMARAGVLMPHVWDEISAQHAPTRFGQIVLNGSAAPLSPERLALPGEPRPSDEIILV